MTIDVSAAPLDIPHVAWTDSLDGLAAIRDSGTTMAIHPRVPDAAIAAFVNHRAMADFCCLRCEVRNVGAEIQIERELDQAGLPASFGRWAFGADIARLVAAFSRLSGASTIRLRLDRITDDACRLFHPDNVPVRLVCTYRGPATQWLPEDICDRSGIGSGDNDRICRDWSRVQSLRPFWVGAMKGERWPGPQGGGLLHRSPPLETGDWRLFLALDPVE